MLTMLFETGHPWITFKDACNVRSPQQHVGVVHSSNLCTEITLNTGADRDRGLQPRLGQPGPAHRRRQARPGQAQEDGRDGDADARQRHRHQLLRGQEGARLQPAPSAGRPRHHGLPGRAVRDQACRTRRRRRSSSPTARWRRSATTPTGPRPSWPQERGRYSSYRGSLWDRGILPIDSLDLLAEQRGSLKTAGQAAGRDRPQRDARLGRAARADRRARHAQLELRRDRADRDDLEHRRRQRLDRAVVRQPVGQVEPVGRVHRSSTSTWCAT